MSSSVGDLQRRIADTWPYRCTARAIWYRMTVHKREPDRRPVDTLLQTPRHSETFSCEASIWSEASSRTKSRTSRESGSFVTASPACMRQSVPVQGKYPQRYSLHQDAQECRLVVELTAAPVPHPPWGSAGRISDYRLTMRSAGILLCRGIRRNQYSVRRRTATWSSWPTSSSKRLRGAQR